jgi:uncharacterized cupredoxin-like copper-binding protein
LRLVALAPVVVAGLALASCGSSKNDSKNKPAPVPPKVSVTATEYAFTPRILRAKAGMVRIELKNRGKVRHELVIIRTSKSPGALKVTKGRVSEKSSVGEIGETQAGATTTTTFDLKKGTYVFVCNIKGHYADGMRGRLTVR